MSNKKLKIYINNKLYKARIGETILDVALREGIKIPHLCKHPDLSIKANCRVCLVEVEGKGIVTSCSTQVEEGMKVKTNTPKVERARKINLELIFSEHIEKCNKCIYQNNCAILRYAREYGLKISRFFDRKKGYPIWQFGDSIQFDSSKCIDCRNCVEVCQVKQAVDFYEIAERGVETVVKPKGKPNIKCHSEPVSESREILEQVQDDNNIDLLKNDPDKFDCTYCGQCIVHCPVGAISEVPHWQEVEKLLEEKKNKILVAQIAPSVRVSIGEEFNQEPGKIMTGQLIASIKQIGFDYVFDANLGADITAYEEAKELAEWLEKGKERPMFTSCCPAWVKFVEFYYPEFIPHLATTKSPHICLGSLVKTYFADYLKKDPEEIVVVSIMPCTAKKHEINLDSHKLDSSQNGKMPAVDYVLTTREYAYLLHKHKIDLPNLKPMDLDKPLDIYSGASVIYDINSGAMEAVLQSLNYFFKDQAGPKQSLEPTFKVNPRLQSRKYQELESIKTARIKIGNRKLKVAAVSGLANAKKVLDDLQNEKVKYDYVEVMACPGGCVGGGGQPAPTSSEIRAKRALALYEINKNLPIKTTHKNPLVLKIYQEYFSAKRGGEELIKKILHSGFKTSKREGYFQT